MGFVGSSNVVFCLDLEVLVVRRLRGRNLRPRDKPWIRCTSCRIQRRDSAISG